MILLICDIVLLIIVQNLKKILFINMHNQYFDFLIYSYLLFCLLMLPIVLIFKKNIRTLMCHFVSLAIINLVVFYTFRLSLRSLLFSAFILELLILLFMYIRVKKKGNYKNASIRQFSPLHLVFFSWQKHQNFLPTNSNLSVYRGKKQKISIISKGTRPDF